MTLKHHCYGSFCDCSATECRIDEMPDLERTASRGLSSLSSPPSGTGREKTIAMRQLLDQVPDQDSIVSEESCDSAQAGVKRLEAISSTWSRTGLYFAYLGCDL